MRVDFRDTPIAAMPRLTGPAPLPADVPGHEGDFQAHFDPKVPVAEGIRTGHARPMPDDKADEAEAGGLPVAIASAGESDADRASTAAFPDAAPTPYAAAESPPELPAKAFLQVGPAPSSPTRALQDAKAATVGGMATEGHGAGAAAFKVTAFEAEGTVGTVGIAPPFRPSADLAAVPMPLRWKRHDPALQGDASGGRILPAQSAPPPIPSAAYIARGGSGVGLLPPARLADSGSAAGSSLVAFSDALLAGAAARQAASRRGAAWSESEPVSIPRPPTRSPMNSVPIDPGAAIVAETTSEPRGPFARSSDRRGQEALPIQSLAIPGGGIGGQTGRAHPGAAPALQQAIPSLSVRQVATPVRTIGSRTGFTFPAPIAPLKSDASPRPKSAGGANHPVAPLFAQQGTAAPSDAASQPGQPNTAGPAPSHSGGGSVEAATTPAPLFRPEQPNTPARPIGPPQGDLRQTSPGSVAAQAAAFLAFPARADPAPAGTRAPDMPASGSAHNPIATPAMTGATPAPGTQAMPEGDRAQPAPAAADASPDQPDPPPVSRLSRDQPVTSVAASDAPPVAVASAIGPGEARKTQFSATVSEGSDPPVGVKTVTRPDTSAPDRLPQLAPPVPARAMQVVQQIAPALKVFPGGLAEITLSPSELGHVRLSMQAEGDTIVVHIVADRRDTHDLLQRHTALLSAALRDAGFADVQYAFSQGRHQASPPRDDTARDGEAIAERPQPAPAPPRLSGDRLDLRL